MLSSPRTQMNRSSISMSSPRGERRIRWPTSHLFIIGLLVYIAAFQTVVFTSHSPSVIESQGYGEDHNSIKATSLQSHAKNATAEAIQLLKHLQQRHVPVQSVQSFRPIAWRRQSKLEIKVPYPIFVTSLPKTGTTSIFKYFRCGGVRSSHNWVSQPGTKKTSTAGKCIQANIVAGFPPFEGCGAVDLFSDTGYIDYDHDTGLKCFFPSIDGLDAIYNAYPNATFVNTVRKTENWYNSLKAWGEGSLFIRMRLCNATNFPNGQSAKDDFTTFYDWQNEYIRDFVKRHPSLTYLEVELESPLTGATLFERTGITESCWRKCLPDSPKCEPGKEKPDEKH